MHIENATARPAWSRRRFALALPLLGALPCVASGSAWAAAVPLRASRTLMGTRVDIVLDPGDTLSPTAAQRAIEHAFARMQALEALLSRYQEGSVVRSIGAASGKKPVAVPPEVMAILQAAQQVAAQSQGAFDPTVGALAAWNFQAGHEAAPSPAQIAWALRHIGARDLHLDAAAGTAYLARPGMALDLGGIAKLPILEAGLQVLEQAGVRNALINGGGDVLIRGHLQGRPWRIGVRDPRAPQKLLGTLDVEGRAIVASSGDYERGFVLAGKRLHHVLNPQTGWPTEGVHGVALLAREVAAVNGWGTALMVQGMAAIPAWSAQHPQVALLAAGSNGAVWKSPRMEATLQSV